MNILVPTKRVINPDEAIRVRPDGREIDSAQVGHVINPFDAIALEEALRIREQASGGCEVSAVSIGTDACEEQLRTALAMGADRRSASRRPIRSIRGTWRRFWPPSSPASILNWC
jgi:electron transfer flavoprotein beta subunit